MRSHVEQIRETLIKSRKRRRWSQAELGRQAGLPQAHISAIETGKVLPRIDTLVELLRILDYDLIPVPREFVPAVQSLVREPGASDQPDEDDRPLYAPDDGDEVS
jgi:transcriptional regulator with XRE-family HTH domain